MSNTTLSYGTYPFSPVPLLRLGITANKAGNGELLGLTWTATFTGDLVEVSGGGLTSIRNQQDLLEAAIFEQDQGSRLLLKCDATTLLDVYPRVTSLSFDPGIWVNRSPYTIEMEFDSLVEDINQYVSAYDETWTFEMVNEKSVPTDPGADDAPAWTILEAANSNGELATDTPDYLPFQARITHTVNATGKTVYDSGGRVKPAYQQARDFVVARLVSSPTSEIVENSGVINFFPANQEGQYFDHYRTVNQDDAAGTYSVSESWLMLTDYEDGFRLGNATEDFTIETRSQADGPYKTVAINGTIQGLESRDYGVSAGDFEIDETKYKAAIDYYTNVKTRIFARCNQVGLALGLPAMNPIPFSTSESFNPYNGTITYNREYNSRSANCLLISEDPDVPVYSETINMTDNNGGDAFAQIFVLGREDKGPVLQNLNTKTVRTRSLQIECVLNPPSTCFTAMNIATIIAGGKPTNCDAIVDIFEGDLQTNSSKLADQIFKSEDVENYSFKEGRYFRNVTWTWGKC